MRSTPSILLLAAALLLALGAAPAGAAFTATKLDPGGETLDLGAAPVARLLFGTLRSSSDVFRANVTVPSGESAEFALLVPDRRPESKLSAADLPVATFRMLLPAGATPAERDAPVSEIPLRAVTDPPRRTEPSTGLPFREIARFDLADADVPAGTHTYEITVRGGGATSRAALLVNDGSRFGLRDAQHTPHAVGQLLGWYDVPVAAPGTADARDSSAVPKRAIAPAILALAMLMIAVWWLRSGRATARRRGRERLG